MGVLSVLGKIAGGLLGFGNVLGKQQEGEAKGQATQAQLQQGQDRNAVDLYGTQQNAQNQAGQLDLQRKGYENTNRSTTAKQALIAALVTGLTQANAGTAAAIKDALSSATTMAREPIPENKQAPGISVYSHPDGDLKTPRTALKCPMFLSVYDENRKAAGAFEYHQDTLTEHERVTLNLVQPGEYWIERADGERGICLVVVQKDSLGQPIRQLIAFPQGWLATDQFAQMPNLKSLLTQLLEPQTAAA